MPATPTSSENQSMDSSAKIRRALGSHTELHKTRRDTATVGRPTGRDCLLSRRADLDILAATSTVGAGGTVLF